MDFLILVALIVIIYLLYRSQVQRRIDKAETKLEDYLKHYAPHLFYDFHDELKKWHLEDESLPVDEEINWFTIHKKLREKYENNKGVVEALDYFSGLTADFELENAKDIFTPFEINFLTQKTWEELEGKTLENWTKKSAELHYDLGLKYILERYRKSNKS